MTSESGVGALEIVQRYPHPVDLVFDAWSKPSEVKSWWGPKDFTATTFENDFREGGTWRAVIVGPDGKPLSQSGRYTRIETNNTIAFTFKWDNADSPETDVTVAFNADGDEAIVTFRQAPFSSEESRHSHEEGWRECLDRLSNNLGGTTS